MKKYFIIPALVAAFVMFSCKERAYIDAPGENSHNLDSLPQIADPTPTPDPAGIDIPDSCLTVTQALKIGKDLGAGGTSEKKYYIKGWIQSLDEKNSDGIQSYGNATFYMAESNTGRNRHTFEAFQVYGKDGKPFKAEIQVQVGDFVIIYGPITNYNGTIETPSKGAAHVYASTNTYFDPQMDPTNITPDPEGANVPDGCITVYDALHIADSIGAGKTTSGEYYIKGWISSLHKDNASGITGSYHNATFYITPTNDGTTIFFPFEAYRVKGPNKSDITNVGQIQVGDFVVLRCKIQNYSGTAETASGGYIYYSSNPNLQ